MEETKMVELSTMETYLTNIRQSKRLYNMTEFVHLCEKAMEYYEHVDYERHQGQYQHIDNQTINKLKMYYINIGLMLISHYRILKLTFNPQDRFDKIDMNIDDIFIKFMRIGSVYALLRMEEYYLNKILRDDYQEKSDLVFNMKEWRMNILNQPLVPDYPKPSQQTASQSSTPTPTSTSSINVVCASVDTSKLDNNTDMDLPFEMDMYITYDQLDTYSSTTNDIPSTTRHTHTRKQMITPDGVTAIDYIYNKVIRLYRQVIRNEQIHKSVRIHACYHLAKVMMKYLGYVDDKRADAIFELFEMIFDEGREYLDNSNETKQHLCQLEPNSDVYFIQTRNVVLKSHYLYAVNLNSIKSTLQMSISIETNKDKYDNIEIYLETIDKFDTKINEVLSTASEFNYYDAMNEYALNLKNMQNFGEMIVWYKKLIIASQYTHVEAMCELGDYYKKQQDNENTKLYYNMVVEWCKRFIPEYDEDGNNVHIEHPDSVSRQIMKGLLGILAYGMYYKDVERNYDEMERVLEIGANRNDVLCMSMLVDYYKENKPAIHEFKTSKDMINYGEKLLSYLIKLATRGDKNSCIELSQYYHRLGNYYGGLGKSL
jgi:tetratricopeptide (TPR) repeat protein